MLIKRKRNLQCGNFIFLSSILKQGGIISQPFAKKYICCLIRKRFSQPDRRVVCGYVKMTTSQYPFNNLGQGASVCEGFKKPSQGSSMQVQDIFISHSAHNSSNTVCLLLWLLSGGHTLYMCRCVDKALHTHTIPGPNCHYPTSQIKSYLPVSVRCLFVLPFPSRLSFSLTQL